MIFIYLTTITIWRAPRVSAAIAKINAPKEEIAGLSGATETVDLGDHAMRTTLTVRACADSVLTLDDTCAKVYVCDCTNLVRPVAPP